MKLAYWMYAGPAHIGTLRVASSFKNVHAIMHAPLGDDYFNVMRSMLERERDFTPVTASIVDRHVLARGSQEKVVENITRKHKEESPDLVLLTPTCTSSILQEDLHNFVERSTLALTSAYAPTLPEGGLPSAPTPEQCSGEGAKGTGHGTPGFVLSSEAISKKHTEKTPKGILNTALQGEYSQPKMYQPDVILADVNHYRVNELQAADRTLEQIVRFYIEKAKKQNILDITKTENPSVNIIGIFTLGFHNQHDCRELKRLFNDLGIAINEIIPEGGSVHNLKNLPKAWFNFVPYREVGLMTAVYLKTEFNMPFISTTPMGLVDTALCIREIGTIIDSLHQSPAQQGDSCACPVMPLPEQLCLIPVPFAPKGHKSSLPQRGNNCPEGTKNFYAPLGQRVGDKADVTGQKAGATGPSVNSFRNNLFVKSKNVPSQCLEGEKQTTHLPHTRTMFLYGAEDRGNGHMAQPIITAESIPSALSPYGAKGILTKSVFSQNVLDKYIEYIDEQTRFISQAAWFARSIDCQNLTGKKAVVFGDATHSAAMTKILAREMGIRVSCAGTYCKHDADWFREQVSGFCDQILITDDHTQVGDMIALLEPAAIFGTQMERHVGKRLDIPCGVISAPVHIQNFPLGYRPFLGYEGANQIADLVYNSFSLGMEDHLLQIFGGHDSSRQETMGSNVDQNGVRELLSEHRSETGLNNGLSPKGILTQSGLPLTWSADGLTELNKVPGFVRGKVKRNTEKYALQNKIDVITVEVMYAAKEAMSA